MPEQQNDYNRLSEACYTLARMQEATNDLFSIADYADSVTFNREDGTPQTGAVFNYGMAYAQALQRPSATACAYIMEMQLRMLRARSRAFASLNPYWAAVKKNRIAYVVGTGHVVAVSPRRPSEAVPDDLEGKIADELRTFCRLNKYRRRQGEKLTRLDRDGEFFLRFIDDKKDGILRVRFIEPLLVQDPPGKGPQNNSWFGIQFDGTDYEEPLGYYIRSASYLGGLTDAQNAQWQEMVPADQIQHRTVNVDIGSPRGLPSTYTLQATCSQALSTLKSMGKLVDIRARIALIRKQVNATLGQITPLLNRNRIGQSSDALGNMRNVFSFPYGGIVDTNDQREFQMPAQRIETDKIVCSLKSDLQAVAAAMGLADFTISGDSCHDTETELMTKRGWLRHDQIVDGDVAGTVNPTTRQFEWQEIDHLCLSEYSGNMVQFTNGSNLDMLVTPNHRMYVDHPAKLTEKFWCWGLGSTTVRKGSLDFVRADDIVTGTAIPNYCRSGNKVAEEHLTTSGIQLGNGVHVYYMLSQRQADDIQMLAIQCGHAANIKKQGADGKVAIAIGETRRRTVVETNQIFSYPYTGTVWCVAVPNGIIITRRNGKMAISGNSAAFANALVKEGPMDRAIGSEQADMIDDDVEVYERALTLAAENGRLPDNVLEIAQLDITPPGVIARDRLVNTQADEILVRSGAMSTDTMAKRSGLSPDDEREKIKTNPSPAISADGTEQPAVGGKATARGVPSGAEPGPRVNPRKA